MDISDLDLSKPLSRAKFMMQYLKNLQSVSWDNVLYKHLNLVSASVDAHDSSVGRATFELTVADELCNSNASLHGGCVATIFDLCTSIAVATLAREGFWDAGHVSRSLNCSYVRPAPVNTKMIVECEVASLGKSLAMLRGTMRRKSDGKVCFFCEHHKVLVNPRPALEASDDISKREKSKYGAGDTKSKM